MPAISATKGCSATYICIYSLLASDGVWSAVTATITHDAVVLEALCSYGVITGQRLIYF